MSATPASSAVASPLPGNADSARRSGLIGVGVPGLADQALISATNFATMVLLARELGPAAFGSFALVYTALLFATELQGSLVTQPHNVLGVGRTAAAYVRYTSSTALGQILLAASAGLLAALAGLGARLTGWSAAPLLLALAPAVVAWLCQEFVRRVLYTEGRITAVLANDVVSYGGQAAAMVVLWRIGRLDGPSALLALAATSALGAALGAWQLRGSLRRRAAATDLRENWQFGKWLVGALLAYWCASQLYLYLTAALVGAGAAGLLKAALVLMGPLNVLLIFMDTAVPIVLARALAESGEAGVRTRYRETVALTAPLVIAYCVTAAVFAEPLLRLVYGERYARDHSFLLVLFAVDYLVIYVGRLLAARLRARRQTRPIFRGHLYAGVGAVVGGWLAIHIAGVEGAAAGMVVSAAVVAAVLFRASGRQGQRGEPADARA